MSSVCKGLVRSVALTLPFLKMTEIGGLGYLGAVPGKSAGFKGIATATNLLQVKPHWHPAAAHAVLHVKALTLANPLPFHFFWARTTRHPHDPHCARLHSNVLDLSSRECTDLEPPHCAVRMGNTCVLCFPCHLPSTRTSFLSPFLYRRQSFKRFRQRQFPGLCKKHTAASSSPDPWRTIKWPRRLQALFWTTLLEMRCLPSSALQQWTLSKRCCDSFLPLLYPPPQKKTKKKEMLPAPPRPAPP